MGCFALWHGGIRPLIVSEHRRDPNPAMLTSTHQQVGTAKSAAMNNIRLWTQFHHLRLFVSIFNIRPVLLSSGSDVGGLPVIASAKVNPYALKEARGSSCKMIEAPSGCATRNGRKQCPFMP